jgi:hypothetical protein
MFLHTSALGLLILFCAFGLSLRIGTEPLPARPVPSLGPVPRPLLECGSRAPCRQPRLRDGAALSLIACAPGGNCGLSSRVSLARTGATRIRRAAGALAPIVARPAESRTARALFVSGSSSPGATETFSREGLERARDSSQPSGVLEPRKRVRTTSRPGTGAEPPSWCGVSPAANGICGPLLMHAYHIRLDARGSVADGAPATRCAPWATRSALPPAQPAQPLRCDCDSP